MIFRTRRCKQFHMLCTRMVTVVVASHMAAVDATGSGGSGTMMRATTKKQRGVSDGSRPRWSPRGGWRRWRWPAAVVTRQKIGK